MAPITHRQYIVLHAFAYPKGWPSRPPTLMDVGKLLGATTRGGVYCGHIVPLMAKGYLVRVKEPFEPRGYAITQTGRKVMAEYRRSLKHDDKSGKQGVDQVGDSQSHQVESHGAPQEQAEHAAQLRDLQAVRLLRSTLQ